MFMYQDMDTCNIRISFPWSIFDQNTSIWSCKASTRHRKCHILDRDGETLVDINLVMAFLVIRFAYLVVFFFSFFRITQENSMTKKGGGRVILKTCFWCLYFWYVHLHVWKSNSVATLVNSYQECIDFSHTYIHQEIEIQ